MILASQEAIREWERKGCWVKKTLLDDFMGHVKAMPGRTAVVDPYNKEALLGTPAERIDYQTFAAKVEGLAASLAEAGVEKDDMVMVQMPNCWELAALYLAVAKAGGTMVPAPMQWRSKELGYVADLTGAKVLITVKDFHGHGHLAMAGLVKQGSPSLKNILSYEDVRKMAETKPNPDLTKVHVEGNDIFTICWTSGTEAQPKGCPLSHNNWRCQSTLAMAGGARPGDVALTAGPMVNMASVGTVFVPWLLLGGTLVLHHPFDPQVLLQQMIKEQIQWTLLVPAVVNLMLKHPALANVDLSFLRSITVGSAPPSLWSLQEFKNRWDVEIGNIWGQNEGTAIISGVADVPDMNIRVDHLPRYGAPGVKWSTPMADFITTKVVGPTGEVLTEDEGVGELCYRGPNVIPGYFKRPELTGKTFDEEGYIRTGDLFQIKGGGKYLKFFDRAKDIIIRGGNNISAQEVENALLANTKLQDVAAVGYPDEDLGERMAVYVVPKPGETVTLKELVAFMKEQGVAVYKLPERLEVVEAIPRNPVGKIVKKDLRADIKRRMGTSQN